MAKKVFVSGCYDMLHSGHVAFFEEAARHGNLYVGLGSDKTICELKGRKTINNDAERLCMGKAIRYVKDAAERGRETQRCFEAQLRMFPAMLTPDVAEEIEKLRSTALGWKLNGAGGGGYLILVSEKEIPNAVRIHIRRS